MCLALSFLLLKQGENYSYLQEPKEFVKDKQIKMFAKNQEGIFPWVLVKMMSCHVIFFFFFFGDILEETIVLSPVTAARKLSFLGSLLMLPNPKIEWSRG